MGGCKSRANPASCKEAGLAVFAQTDLILFPKRLIEKFGIEDRFGDPRDPLVRKLLRAQISEIFEQFPQIATLYIQDYDRHIPNPAHRQVNKLRDKPIETP